MEPQLSSYFQSRKPSAIRLAQIKFMQRKDKVKAVNTAIGNVSLPMHPFMIKRMHHFRAKNCPFNQGVVRYTATVGLEETNQAFLNIIRSSGFKTKSLYSQITDGASQAMELVILAVCGPAGTKQKPLLLIDPAYTNYMLMAKRVGRNIISITRTLKKNGQFNLPNIKQIEKVIKKYRPGGILIIPYDNPSGQLFGQNLMINLAKLCVKYNLWLISDEAYRELYYGKQKPVSIWGLTEKNVPGIAGRRVSLESASKVFNSCGLRIGAIVTDNKTYHEKSVAENTANLCPNAIGQYIFGSLAHTNHQGLKKWYQKQRNYYAKMMFSLTKTIRKIMPDIIISQPQASIYSIIDVKNLVGKNFNSQDFVVYCASYGKVKLGSDWYTLLVSPMEDFYNVSKNKANPGRTQMRIAYVEKPKLMQKVPYLFKELFSTFLRLGKN